MRSLNLPRLSLVISLLLCVFTSYTQDESLSNKLFPERSIYLQFSPTYGKFFTNNRGTKNYFTNWPWSYKLGWEMELGFDVPLRNPSWITSLGGGYQNHKIKLSYNDITIVNNGFFLKTGISRRLGQRFHLGFFPWIKWLTRQEQVKGEPIFQLEDYADTWYGFTLLNQYNISNDVNFTLGFSHGTAIRQYPLFNLNGSIRTFDREFPFWFSLGVRWYPKI